MEKPRLYQKYKISWVWWHMPVILAAWEAKAGESLEPGRQKLQCAEIMSLHSSLGNKSETLSLSLSLSHTHTDTHTHTHKSLLENTMMYGAKKDPK